MIRITDGFVGARNSLEEGDDGPPKFLDLQSTRLQCTVFGPAQRVFRKYSKNVNRLPLALPGHSLIGHPDDSSTLKDVSSSMLNLNRLLPRDVLADPVVPTIGLPSLFYASGAKSEMLSNFC